MWSAMEELSLLTRLSGLRVPGPLPSFSDYHILWAMDIIDLEGSIGRSRLSKSLGLGEGVGRTIIERLRDEGLIQVSRSGCSLTDRGRNVLEGIRRHLSRSMPLTESPIGLGRSNVVILVREASRLVRSGIEERDASIRAGALGAMTLVYSDKILSVPGLSDDSEKDFPEITSQLLGHFQPGEGDVFLIAAADTLTVAELAVRAAALSLLRSERF